MGCDLPHEIASRVGGHGVDGDHAEEVVVHPGVGLAVEEPGGVRVRVRVRVRVIGLGWPCGRIARRR